MWLKHIIALSLAAVAASQKLDNCTVSLHFTASGENDYAQATDCVFPELSHADCYRRYNALRAAFRAPPSMDKKTCNYELMTDMQLSVPDFLNSCCL